MTLLREQLATATAEACRAYEDNVRLVRVLTVLGQPFSPEEMSARALTILSHTFDADVACMARLVGDRLVVTSACGLPDGDPAYAEGWECGPAAASALRGAGPISCDEREPCGDNLPRALSGLGIRSAAWIPSDGGSGADNELLILYRRSRDSFTPAELQILGSVAFRISVALATRERSVRAELLARSGYRLTQHLHPPSLFDETSRLLRDLVHADVAGVLTVLGDQVKLSAHRGGEVSSAGPRPVEDLPGWSLLSGGDPYRHSSGMWFDAAVRPALSMLCVPVMRDGAPAAVLLALRDLPRPFRDDDVEMATTLAYYLRSAMVNAELYRALQDREAALRLITDSVSDLIAVVDASGEFRYASPSHQRELGHRPDHLCGSDLLALVHPDEARAVASALANPDASPKVEYRMATGTGRWIWVESALRPAATPARAVVLSSRVIEERRRLEDELRQRATHDPLTGLANRVLVSQRLEEALSGDGSRDHRGVGLLFCDLDKFKAVNDRLGHELGDELLQLVAARLRTCVRQCDLLARVSGDEFVFVLPGVGDLAAVAEIGRCVVAALEAPFNLRGEAIRSSVSVGGVCGQPGRTTPGAMMRNADAAMYSAKRRGPGRVEVFDEEASRRSLDRLEVRSELQHALDRRQLTVHYQPVFDLRTGVIVTFEALLRWYHPKRGLIRPDVFIPLAEESGAIVPIGNWVLDQAARQLAAWQGIALSGRAGRQPLAINVNLSSYQFNRDKLATELLDLVYQAGVDPADVWLEITEHGALRADAADSVTQLRDSGIHLCLDDFGISHSNLDYLARLPVECLKIDRSFVAGLTGNPDRRRVNRGIVRAVLAIADSLGLSVVAEGIETAEQRDVVRDLGCALGQGYLLSEPLPAAEATELVLRQSTSSS